MAKMRGVVVKTAGGDVELEERDVPEPRAGALLGRLMIETLPPERAAEAYEKMLRGSARFRMVLTTGA